MHRLVGIAAFAVAGLILGCSPGKELPSAELVSKGTAPPDAETAPKLPMESDPVAKAAAGKAIRAITQNKPELMAKVRATIVKTKGTMRLPDPTATRRTVEAAWPDRIRVVYEFENVKEGVPSKQTWGLHSPTGWTTVPIQLPITPTALGQYIQTNMQAEHWLPIGLGLGDDGEILFDPRTQKTPSGIVTTIKVKSPERPVYMVSFDDQTGLPVRIDYAPMEMGNKDRTHKVINILEHKDYGGLKLPAKMETHLNEIKGEEWTVEGWEFPEKLDNSLFDPLIK